MVIVCLQRVKRYSVVPEITHTPKPNGRSFLWVGGGGGGLKAIIIILIIILMHSNKHLASEISIYKRHFTPRNSAHVNIADFNNANGDPAKKEWFNKLDGRNGTEYLYVRTAFAVVASNLGLKSTAELEFLQSEAFSYLKCTINSH